MLFHKDLTTAHAQLPCKVLLGGNENENVIIAHFRVPSIPVKTCMFCL